MITSPRSSERLGASAALDLATLAADRLRIGRRRVLLGRSPRNIQLAIRPGRKALALSLVLRSGRYSTRISVSILR